MKGKHLPPNNNPANKATVGTQIPINIPIAPTISKAPVKKLKTKVNQIA